MVTAAISGESLYKSFGRRRILKGVDLTLETGQIVALMGRNGAGKTTLLRILATLLQADTGKLTFFGSSLKGNEPSIRARLGVALHAPMLYPDLTAEENLVFFARLYEVNGVGSRLDSIFKQIHLEGQRRQSVGTLSRGMTQRLALGRALINRPELLLLDEPFTGLDLESVRWIEQTLSDFRSEGGTVLYVSHDFERIPQLADQGYILHQGVLTPLLELREMNEAQLREHYQTITGSPE